MFTRTPSDSTICGNRRIRLSLRTICIGDTEKRFSDRRIIYRTAQGDKCCGFDDKVLPHCCACPRIGVRSASTICWPQASSFVTKDHPMGSLDENIGTDFEMADEAWDQLAGWLEQFAAAWKDQGQPPELSGFAPSEPAEIRRLTLVELVKLDMEYRVEADHPRRLIEEYCETFPELAADGIPVDLLYEEFHIRRNAGESVEPQEYCQRFPHEYASLQQLLQLNTSSGTTSLLAAAPPVDLKPGDQIDDFDLLAFLGKGASPVCFSRGNDRCNDL